MSKNSADKPARILIVDDEGIIAMDLKQEMIALGYDVCGTALSGEAALEITERERPDLVLMDIVLAGEMDGIQTADAIREKYHIPVVFITAYADQERLKRAKLTYPFGYILKPFQSRELGITVEMALFVGKVEEERRKIEEALRESEEKYRDLVENLNEVIYTLQADGTITFVSPAVETVIGYAPNELIGTRFFPLIHPDDLERIRGEFSELLQGRVYPREFRLLAKDGAIHWVRSSSRPVHDGERLIGLQGMLTDITEQKIADEKIQEQARLNQILLDSFPCVALLMRPKTREIMALNKAAKEAGCLIGLSCFRTWPKFKEPCPWCLAEDLWGEGRPKSAEVEALGIIWDAHWVPVSDDLYLHYAFDITEQHRVQEALQESEERQRQIIDNSDAGYFLIDGEGVFQQVNPAWLRMHKYDTEAEVIGRHFSLTQVAADLAPAQNIVEQIFGGQRIISGEFSRRCRDGSIGHHSFSARPVTKGGEIVGIEGFLIDLTESKQFKETLRDTNRQLTDILGSISEGFFVLNHDLEVTYFNPAAEKLLGRKTEDVLGRNLFESFPEAIGSVFEERYSAAVKMKKKDAFETYFGVVPYENWYDVRIYPFQNGITVYFQVISERKRIEDALRESEKQFRTLAETVNVIAWEYDLIIDQWNYVTPQSQKILGYLPGEWKNFNWWAERIYEEDREQAIAFCKEETGKKADHAFEYRFLKKDGSVIWLQDIVHVILEKEVPVALRGIMIEVTERKAAEEALNQKVAELERFNKLTVDRELRMVELKKEINALLLKAGEKEKYRIVE